MGGPKQSNRLSRESNSRKGNVNGNPSGKVVCTNIREQREAMAFQERDVSYNAEATSLKLKIQSLKSMRQKDQHEIQELRSSLHDAEGKLERAQRNAKAWTLEIDQFQKSQSQLTEKNLQLVESASKLENQLNEERKVRRNLEDELHKARSQQNEWQTKYNQLSDAHSCSQLDNEKLKIQIAAIHDSARKSDEERKEMEVQVGYLTSQLETSKKKNDKFRLEAIQKIKETRMELKELKKEHQSALSSKEKGVKKLESSLVDAKDAEIQNLHEKINRVEEEAHKQREYSKSIINEKGYQIEQLLAAQADVQEKLQVVLEEKGKLQDVIEELQDRVQSLSHSCQKNRRELEVYID
jgi:chromosome segregation ATPase